MTETLDRILTHLRRLERGAPDRLQRGLTRDELRVWEKKLSLLFTEELESLYCWRNGTREEPADVFEMRYFFPGYYFVPLEEAAEIYRGQRIDPEWLPGWLPVFANGGGDYLIVPCAQQRMPTSSVLGWEHGEPDKSAEYETVSSLLQTVEAAFREGAFFVDDEDMMDVDQEQYRRIALQFNPTIRKWQN